MEPEAYNGLAACCKQVIHAAADVRHYADGDDSLLDIPAQQNLRRKARERR